MAIVDEDLVKAELALKELRRAQTEPFKRSLEIVRHLAHTTSNKGTRGIKTETAHADAWLAICALGQTLEKEKSAPNELWVKAIALTQQWKSLLA